MNHCQINQIKCHKLSKHTQPVTAGVLGGGWGAKQYFHPHLLILPCSPGIDADVLVYNLVLHKGISEPSGSCLVSQTTHLPWSIPIKGYEESTKPGTEKTAYSCKVDRHLRYTFQAIGKDIKEASGIINITILQYYYRCPQNLSTLYFVNSATT